MKHFLTPLLALTLSSAFAQQADSIDMSQLIGLWVPVDSVYEEMKYQHACIEITETTWSSYQCINQVLSNTKWPYSVDGNEIRVVAHEVEQVHFEVLKLTRNELIFNEYFVRDSGRLKSYRKNARFIRR